MAAEVFYSPTHARAHTESERNRMRDRLTETPFNHQSGNSIQMKYANESQAPE